MNKIPEELVQTIVYNLIYSDNYNELINYLDYEFSNYKELKGWDGTTEMICDISENCMSSITIYNEKIRSMYDDITNKIHNTINSLQITLDNFNTLMSSNKFWITILGMRYPWFKIYNITLINLINWKNLAIELSYIEYFYDISENFDNHRMDMLSNIIEQYEFINSPSINYYNSIDKLLNIHKYIWSYINIYNDDILDKYISSTFPNNNVSAYLMIPEGQEEMIMLYRKEIPNNEVTKYIKYNDDYTNLIRILLYNDNIDYNYKIKIVLKLFNFGSYELMDYLFEDPNILNILDLPDINGMIKGYTLHQLLTNENFENWIRIYVKYLLKYNISYDNMTGLKYNLSVETIKILHSIEGFNILKFFLNNKLNIYNVKKSSYLYDNHYKEIYETFLNYIKYYKYDNILSSRKNNEDVTIYMTYLIETNNIREFISKLNEYNKIDWGYLTNIIFNMNTDINYTFVHIIIYYLNKNYTDKDIIFLFKLSVNQQYNNKYKVYIEKYRNIIDSYTKNKSIILDKNIIHNICNIGYIKIPLNILELLDINKLIQLYNYIFDFIIHIYYSLYKQTDNIKNNIYFFNILNKNNYFMSIFIAQLVNIVNILYNRVSGYPKYIIFVDTDGYDSHNNYIKELNVLKMYNIYLRPFIDLNKDMYYINIDKQLDKNTKYINYISNIYNTLSKL